MLYSLQRSWLTDRTYGGVQQFSQMVFCEPVSVVKFVSGLFKGKKFPTIQGKTNRWIEGWLGEK
ncbi:hypothetical protein ROBYS_00450 [Roseobacter sp. OBYS 0001]|nr:hypothetical protein ROBYS_00450 [Roseobacter sp. OBYS 0001]